MAPETHATLERQLQIHACFTRDSNPEIELMTRPGQWNLDIKSRIRRQFESGLNEFIIRLWGKVEDVLSKSSALSLTTDEWTSRTQDSEFGIILTDSSRRLEIAGKIHVVAHNNVSCITAAVRVSCDVKHGIKCLAHTFQHSVKDALKRVHEYRTIYNKVSHVASHFKHSAVASFVLQTKQTQLGLNHERLLQSCPTLWDSTFMMCDILLRNRSPISVVMVDRVYTKAAIAVKLEICDRDWSLLEGLITLLKPVKAAATNLLF
ncbi:hypothetical protein PR048_021100 [Dryococelus australis]|uniref:Uncharacterized protein n=1 Tax=Dryococelus australis TaxID=614101 RepID=A0ABQ9GXC9_9NEOP|nr:hypothetical protein PR048_021100 [Dryococelus australis]